MINKKEAAGLWASDDADCYGTAGKNLDSKLVLSKGILLPFGLIWAFVIANCNERPGIRKAIELGD